MMLNYKGAALLGLSLLSPVDVDAQGTELGQGIVTRVNVEKYADIPLDIKDLKDRLTAGSTDGALTLYLEGKNAYLAPDIKFSLHQMSKELANLAATDRTPIYHYHLYGLADREVEGLNDQALYADNFVKTMIETGNALAADAVVALHTWMYATHLLFHGINTCRLLTAADNPDLFTLDGGGMDEFIALWIGSGQQVGSADGDSLYAMTQRAGDLFGTTAITAGEAPVNTEIKLLYNEGAAALAFPNACSRNNGDESVPALWAVAQRIITQMYIPIMQLLLQALQSGDADATRIYALAVVPQIAQCRPSAYKRLKETLLDGTVNINRVSDIIADLQSVYDCLGFTCADVGGIADKIPQCSGIPINQPLAEYTPTSTVHAHSKIDLDILQVRILTSLQSSHFAKQLYMYGRNSAHIRQSDTDPYRVRSLMQMAISNARKAADPFYTEFVEYHNDQMYADTVIRATLDRTNKWGTESTPQMTAVVAKTASYQILYMNALAELAEAVQACKDGDMNSGDGGAHQWDEVAAFLIGSLEGPKEGGSSDLEDGQLMWNLANRRAFQFQTRNAEGYSIVNNHLEDLLYAGRAEADALDCENLAKSADRIQHLMLIPVIQSTIRYAVINKELDASSGNPDLAKGETFALSVLPIIKRYDENAAALIRENMEVNRGQPLVRDGPQAVADAFYESLQEFGYPCALVGAADQADACALAGGFAKVKPGFDKSLSGAAGTMLWSSAAVVVLASLWLV